MTRLEVAALVALLALPATAHAQPEQDAEGQQEATPTLEDLDDIAAQLESSDPQKVREGIDLLTVIDDPAVIPHLAKLLRSGQPDAITDRALEALGALAHPDALGVLAEFTQHRRPGARRRAYEALAQIDHERVPELLEQGLRDRDRGVRGSAAMALGNIGATGSLDVLFQAFEVGVVEAAIAIGKLGDKEAVERFTEHLGDRPLPIMLSCYKRFVRRDDISAKTKTQIVAELGEVSGPLVRRFLEDYLSTFPEDEDSDLQRHVRQTLQRIPDEDETGKSRGGGAGSQGGDQ